MSTRRTGDAYSRRTQALHWLSAALILSMMPLGFLMQDIEGELLKLLAYRLHALLGVVVLVLTVLRILCRWLDAPPEPLPGLSSVHRRGLGGIHVLLYLVLAGLSLSGLVLLMQSGLTAILLGLSSEPIPTDLGEYLPRNAHAIEARVYIALLVSHVGGVVAYQLTKGAVLSRMGVQIGKSAEQRALARG